MILKSFGSINAKIKKKNKFEPMIESKKKNHSVPLSANVYETCQTYKKKKKKKKTGKR